MIPAAISALVALASLYLAWLARRKGRNPAAWLVAGLGGYVLAYVLAGWLIPTFATDEPDKWQTLWINPAFRADFALLLVLLALLAGLVMLISAQVRRDTLTSGSLVLGGVFGGVPLAVWLATALTYSPLTGPVLTFAAVVVIAGLLTYYLQAEGRQWGLIALAAVLIAMQAAYNASIPPPESLLSPGINIPVIIPLLPFFAGVIAGGTLRRQGLNGLWTLGLLAWGVSLLGLLIAYFGAYDFEASFAYDLALWLAGPLLAVLHTFSAFFYTIMPRTLEDAQNPVYAAALAAAFQVIAGLVVWLLVLVRLVRLPALPEPYRWGDYVRGMTQLNLTQRRYLIALMLVLPALLLRSFTTFYPFLETAFLSVQRYNPAFPPRTYVGLQNFDRIATDLVVRESLEFTILFVFVSTFFQVALGLAVAHLLNHEFRLRGFSRMISLIPWAIPMVVVAIGARWMFDDQFGMIPDLFNRVLGLQTSWLINPENAKVAVTTINIWKSTPFVALLLLAGMQGISQDMYEAARVDGANWVQMLRYLTVPMLLPIIVTVSMFMLVWQLAVFDLPYAMTGGGPGFSTTVVAQKIYQDINALNYSYAAAMGMILLFVVGVIGAVGLYLFRRVEVTQ